MILRSGRCFAQTEEKISLVNLSREAWFPPRMLQLTCAGLPAVFSMLQRLYLEQIRHTLLLYTYHRPNIGDKAVIG